MTNINLETLNDLKKNEFSNNLDSQQSSRLLNLDIQIRRS